MNEINLLWIACIILISLALTWWQYNKEWKENLKKSLLFILPRFLAYVCIGLLLINLQFTQRNTDTLYPNLILGIDNTTSIAQHADTAQLKKNIVSMLQDKELDQAFNIFPYTFSNTYAELDTVDFNKPQTNISHFIQEMAKIYPSDHSHILLFTDGQQTLGQAYNYTAKRLNTDIIPVVVGDTANYVDTKIDRVNVNPYTFIDNQFPIEVFLSYNGDKRLESEFTMQLDKEIIFRKKINFSKEKKIEYISIFARANQKGIHTLKAYLKPIAEKNTNNNNQELAIEVIDERTKVLLLYDKLHPDIGMLKKSIESNKQRLFKYFDIKDYNGEISDNNLIIFYQPQKNFAKHIQGVQNQKINHIIITGTQTDYTFLNQIQNGFSKTPSSITEDYTPIRNKSFQPYQLKDIGFDNFPPLQDVFGDISTTSDKDILLYQSINEYTTKQPLVMTSDKLNIKTAYIFGENMWRWRMQSYVDTGDFKTFDNFVDQLIQYVSSKETKKRLISDIKSYYKEAQNNTVNIQFFDNNYNFDPDQHITLEITENETQEIYSYKLILKDNTYTTNINNLPADIYHYQINVKGKTEKEQGTFKIIEFDVEKSFYNADVQQLNQLSDTVFYANQFKNIKNYLLTQKKFTPIQKITYKKDSLINWKLLFILIIVFLSFEWLSRKYHGLI